MNRFDAYIAEYLYENKEAALDKIGIIKISAPHDVQFTCDKKVSTSTGLINFISEKTSKNKFLIASDLESHFAQTREFINIGKPYEIPNIGFIKANNTGTYEFVPFSETNKPVISAQSTKKHKRSNSRSAIQLITLLIVIAILCGLGWEAYQIFARSKSNNAAIINNTSPDTTSTASTPDTTKISHADSAKLQRDSADMLNIKYIFETTASILRAQTRTKQLKSFGSTSGYDSFVHNNTKFYSLYILKPTKIADTLTIKDSLAKFFEKDVTIKIDSTK